MSYSLQDPIVQASAEKIVKAWFQYYLHGFTLGDMIDQSFFVRRELASHDMSKGG